VVFEARGNKVEACRYWKNAGKLFGEIGAVDKVDLVQGWTR